jgi:hypothetical protein
LFTWHRHRRWLATSAKCFVVLLGSPADGGQMFLVTRGSFVRVTSSALGFRIKPNFMLISQGRSINPRLPALLMHFL